VTALDKLKHSFKNAPALFRILWFSVTFCHWRLLKKIVLKYYLLLNSILCHTPNEHAVML